MQYETIIERSTHRSGRVPGDRPGTAAAVEKRFPPALQFLTDIDPVVVNKMQALAWKGHKAGRSLQEICTALHAFARQIGYDPAIGVQEVRTANMPSYPGQTVATALIMLDLREKGEARYGKAG